MKDDVNFAPLRVVVLSLLQVCVFVFLYEAVIELYVSYVGPMKRDIGLGIQVHFSLYVLSVLAGVNALMLTFAASRWLRNVASILAAGAWIFYWLNLAPVYPNRFLLLSALGTLSLFTGVLFTSRTGDIRVSLR